MGSVSWVILRAVLAPQHGPSMAKITYLREAQIDSEKEPDT
tara:strand:+ start:65 stop:187 length:123 start_codon:yes stop_codon:yes gene_type:complete